MRQIFLKTVFFVMLSFAAMVHAQAGHTHGSAEQSPAAHDFSMMSVTSERDFLQGMLAHHQEAVESAELLRQLTQRQQMLALAEDIIEAQSSEIELFEMLLADPYESDAPVHAYQPMMRDLAGLEPAEVDRRFLEDMIQHHLGAIHMARQYLELDGPNGKTPEVIEVANDINVTQRAEIELMRGWLRDWYGIEVELPEWFEGAGGHTGH